LLDVHLSLSTLDSKLIQSVASISAEDHFVDFHRDGNSRRAPGTVSADIGPGAADADARRLQVFRRQGQSKLGNRIEQIPGQSNPAAQTDRQAGIVGPKPEADAVQAPGRLRLPVFDRHRRGTVHGCLEWQRAGHVQTGKSVTEAIFQECVCRCRIQSARADPDRKLRGSAAAPLRIAGGLQKVGHGQVPVGDNGGSGRNPVLSAARQDQRAGGKARQGDAGLQAGLIDSKAFFARIQNRIDLDRQGGGLNAPAPEPAFLGPKSAHRRTAAAVNCASGQWTEGLP